MAGMNLIKKLNALISVRVLLEIVPSNGKVNLIVKITIRKAVIVIAVVIIMIIIVNRKIIMIMIMIMMIKIIEITIITFFLL